MNKLILIVFAIAISFSLFSQEVIIDDDTYVFSEKGSSGPNLSNFSHFYFGGGFLFGSNNTGAEIKMPSSYYLNMGLRYKKRINNFLAVGIAVTNQYDFFKLKQDAGKMLVDTVLHSKENLNFYKLGLEPYIRINFDKRRGNYIGHYLDFGAKVDWNFLMKDETVDHVNSIKYKTGRTGFDIYETTTMYAFARVGINKYEINFTYRLTDLFNVDTKLPQLPIYALGVNFAIINY